MSEEDSASPSDGSPNGPPLSHEAVISAVVLQEIKTDLEATFIRGKRPGLCKRVSGCDHGGEPARERRDRADDLVTLGHREGAARQAVVLQVDHQQSFGVAKYGQRH